MAVAVVGATLERNRRDGEGHSGLVVHNHFFTEKHVVAERVSVFVLERHHQHPEGPGAGHVEVQVFGDDVRAELTVGDHESFGVVAGHRNLEVTLVAISRVRLPASISGFHALAQEGLTVDIRDVKHHVIRAGVGDGDEGLDIAHLRPGTWVVRDGDDRRIDEQGANLVQIATGVHAGAQ